MVMMRSTMPVKNVATVERNAETAETAETTEQQARKVTWIK
jgi:hypothetical protein